MGDKPGQPVRTVETRDPLQDILEERARQDEKWGERDHGDLRWLGILMEEVGELSRCIIEGKITPRSKQKKHELVQVAAVALAWLECNERRKG